jgi:RNA polymerase sigma-54 factor
MKLKLMNKLKQELGLVPKPLLIPLMKLMPLTQLELQQLLQTNIVTNPLLEIVDGQEDEREVERKDVEESEKDPEEDNRLEDLLAEWLQNDQDLSYRPRRAYSEEFLEKVPVVVPTLRDYLLRQLHVKAHSDKEQEIGEYIIYCIGDDGYLECPVHDIADALGEEQEVVEEVVKLIQTFDPPGVGARNESESFLIQLRLLGKDESLAAIIARDYLEALSTKSYAAIARKLKASVQEVAQAAKDIAALEPHPGRGHLSDPVTDKLSEPYEVRYITPDISVESREDGLVVFLNETNMPHIKIARSYLPIIENPEAYDKEASQYVKKKRKDAENLIRNLDMRRKTIMGVMYYIVENQNLFFERGPAYLEPMLMREAAEAVGVHESTISRIAS